MEFAHNSLDNPALAEIIFGVVYQIEVKRVREYISDESLKKYTKMKI